MADGIVVEDAPVFKTREEIMKKVVRVKTSIFPTMHNMF
jgi:hypothetical protein